MDRKLSWPVVIQNVNQVYSSNCWENDVQYQLVISLIQRQAYQTFSKVIKFSDIDVSYD